MLKLPVYVIFGADGLLGRGIAMRLSRENNKYRVFAFPHDICDITESSHVAPLIDFIKPSHVINCAGISDDNVCEELPVNAFKVNGDGAEIIAKACNRVGAKLIHFSTANVFNGELNFPYTEEDPICPISIYGESKVVGEEKIKKEIENHLIIRTGWLFNYEDRNWVSDWLYEIEVGEKIHAISDIKGSPSYVSDVMDATMHLIAAGEKGTFNLANKGCASQYEMAAYMCSLMKEKKNRVAKIKLKSQTWWNAPISKNTELSIEKYEITTGKLMRTWQEAMKHCLFAVEKYDPEEINRDD